MDVAMELFCRALHLIIDLLPLEKFDLLLDVCWDSEGSMLVTGHVDIALELTQLSFAR